jgi:hypothetical protein
MESMMEGGHGAGLALSGEHQKKTHVIKRQRGATPGGTP